MTTNVDEPQTTISLVDCVEPLLDSLNEPVFLITIDRTILHQNAAATRLLELRAGIVARNGKLSFASSASDEAFSRLVVSLYGTEATIPRASAGFLVSRRNSSRDWLVLMRPLGSKENVRVILVQFIGRLRPRQLPKEALRDLFALSDREIDVVTALLASQSSLAVANRMVLGRETIRTHLKRIFRKCNVHSQSELMSLMHCLATFASTHKDEGTH